MELLTIGLELSPSLDFRLRVFRDYLKEKGFQVVPSDPRQLADYRQWLEQKGYALTTIANIISSVRDLYRKAGIETKGWIKSIRQPKGFLRDRVPVADTKKLIDYVNQNCTLRDKLIVWTMASLGRREVELSRMDVGDFYQDGDYHYARFRPKYHDAKDVTKLVTNGLLQVFLEYQNQLKSKNPDDPMFPSRKHGRLRPKNISFIVAELMKKAGVKTEMNTRRITPHSLRHTAASVAMSESGGNVFAVKEFLDHEKVETTMKYIHYAIPPEQRPENLVKW